MFKGLGNIAGMFKQAQEFSGKLQAATAELKRREVTGAAGGGMVEVDANGGLELLRLRLDPQLLVSPDRELLEDLIVAAANQALEKARELHGEAMRDLTGGMELPGIKEAIERFMGPGGPQPDTQV